MSWLYFLQGSNVDNSHCLMRCWELSMKESNQNMISTMVSYYCPHDHLPLPTGQHMWLSQRRRLSLALHRTMEVTGWRRIWPLERIPSLHHRVCIRIYFPLNLTGYEFPGAKDCHIQLMYLSSDREYCRGTLCSASLKTKVTKMPGELGAWGERYHKPAEGCFLLHSLHT